MSSLVHGPIAVDAAVAPPTINANAAITIEEGTGKILYGKDIDKLMGIASMTKMMDEYLISEAVAKGKLKWDDKVTISDYAYEVSQDRSLSNVPLRRGEEYSVEELYQAMAIYSANGAAIAIAEKIAGSEAKFVDMMNKKADELKLGEHHFVNSTGLNNADLKGKSQVGSATDENKMTARGVAKLAQHIVKDYPDVLKTSSIAKKKFREGTSDQIDMTNWNWLLPGLIYAREGVDGLKTGTTDYAGQCLTATAVQDGMRVITVLMHANGGTSDHDKTRFSETNKMLDYAFNNFKLMEVRKADAAVKETIPVDKGKEDNVSLMTKEAVKIVVPKTTTEPKLDEKVTLDKKTLDAPVKKDTKVGTMSVQLKDGDTLGYVDGKKTDTINVVTKDDVEKANWFMLMLSSIGGFFTSIWDYVADGVKGWFN
ncbi:D-alanyl-D-alanine carboxypeptidase [Listeria weihenstephanensis]|uniref:serine-type D-Ala-D-Ala carboxypeptidase n=1 Tax=Listeria weihenstephanensis TaxID=1006155 RepID=A0A1S7FYD2_9LIST|nr:D-alanyl-D-alanine carboxypeptidase PBPD1 [Listeria weihenstephanensis]AQY52399.1 D-alanyl-D-alanine carboxypeptidase [Listeria weihenstephanensis]MBC1499130.1 D-alanyl-D-alanine carboxypeptidase [Listeria weihenstephanensis]